ncbi:hypothetical protein jhhlp_003875 [Lomentospora prolificans]|uniref:LYC1 C-terminal domain-containing protein n=1 Tax=Lomentospora prolificans TaxID=41688 RepID=A0A2N3NA18_9PEZI|nr:hypothetical protein jhhlp_003875 [Lomentospora prolificans]
MGAPQEIDLPSSSSPSLILAHPTPAERERTWTLTQRAWGKVLSAEDYLHREEYLLTVPVAKGGGVTQWILTIKSLPPDQRPILSSCDTIRKTAFVSSSTGTGVEEVVAHGIGAVFTDPVYRGRGYASKMMAMIGEALKRHQGTPMKDAIGNAKSDMLTSMHTPPPPTGLPPVAFSVLFSDIGKTFYASRGWTAHPSTHLSFPPLPQSAPNSDARTDDASTSASPVGYHELAELCARDEALLRKRMAQMLPPSSSTTPGTPHSFVALAPNLDSILWHMMREDFITNRIFGRTPTVRGGVYGSRGQRIWAVWTRAYQIAPVLPPASMEDLSDENTLHILRLVVEDESCTDEYLAEGMRAVLHLARREAFEWGTGHVELWNPVPRLEDAVSRAGMAYEVVEREVDSIPSLMWYGAGPADGVVWVANEKYAWY